MWFDSECGRELFIIKKVQISIRLSWILSTNFINFTMEFLSSFYFIYYLPFADGKAIFISFSLQTKKNERMKKNWKKFYKAFNLWQAQKKRILLIALIHGIPSSFSFSRLIAIKKVFQLFSFLIKIIVATTPPSFIRIGKAKIFIKK